MSTLDQAELDRLLAEAQAQTLDDADALESFRIAHFGRQGLLKDLNERFRAVPGPQKRPIPSSLSDDDDGGDGRIPSSSSDAADDGDGLQPDTTVAFTEKPASHAVHVQTGSSMYFWFAQLRAPPEIVTLFLYRCSPCRLCWAHPALSVARTSKRSVKATPSFQEKALGTP